MSINGSHIEESHQFKTIGACQAFCRVHTNFTHTTAGNAGYVAIHKHRLFALHGARSVLNETMGSNLQHSLHDQLKETIQECKLSYKNIITAGLLGSLTGTKYKMGNGDISHPIIFTYGLGVAAPEFTMWLLVCLMLSLVFGFSFLVPAVLGIVVVAVVEVLIPWINSYNVDPIEEPWMVPKLLDDIRNG